MRGKHIFLTGYMGCGKTSIGKRLSYAVKMPFIDLDSCIEKTAGWSIEEIFEAEGEEGFRERETAELKKLFDAGQSYVVSTGGGIVLREKNRRIMKKQGMVLYLRATADTLYERLKNDTHRPLLQVEDPRSRIDEMLKERGPIYEETADMIVDVDGHDHNGVVKLAKEAYEAEKERRRNLRDAGKEKPFRVLVMHGPNLNFLGIREPEIYGTRTYDELVDYISKEAKETGLDVTFFQSNHEGELIDRIQQAYREKIDGIIINPGALTHYSYALHDALASVDMIEKIEVHLSDITAREGFRAVSVTKEACRSQIYGKGFEGYGDALREIKGYIEEKLQEK